MELFHIMRAQVKVDLEHKGKDFGGIWAQDSKIVRRLWVSDGI